MSGIPLTITTNGADSIVTQADPAQDPSVLNSLNGTNPDAGNSTMTSTNSTTTTSTTTTTTPAPQDDVEGSGDDDDNDDTRDDLTSLFSIGSFITRAALFRRSIRSAEPVQHASEPVHKERKSRQFYSTCNDRITLPCIIEDFISVGSGSIPTCSPVHCGNSLCPPNVSPCRVESTVTPFGIGIHFGDGLNKGGAEENIGACIRYKQLNCI